MVESWSDVHSFPESVEKLVRQRFDVVRVRMVMEQVAQLDVERLKEVTDARLSVTALRRGGIKTVADVIQAPPNRLLPIPGVGETTATHARAAASQLYALTADNLRFRFDPDGRPDDETALLSALRAHSIVERTVPSLLEEIGEVRQTLDQLEATAKPARRWFGLWFKDQASKDAVLKAAEELERLPRSETWQHVNDVVEGSRRLCQVSSTHWPDLWQDFQEHAADIYARLGELADLDLDVAASQGHLPAEIIEAVERQVLDESHLTVSLRGYQAFGAKYALVQRRTMLGDEMGLGKTVTALAVMSHLRALGNEHFLVVCPASVLFNWSYEVHRRSRLKPLVLHGVERHRMVHAWQERGGVALTTFGTLGTLSLDRHVNLSLMVVDEAHYVKNPQAKRSKAIANMASATDRVLFMTGTPMENRLEEFKTLVGYLQPATANRVNRLSALAGPDVFRESVAPVYLRRNQDEVLTELPERIENDDWVQLSPEDLGHYRSAVASKNFMAMRRSAYVAGTEGSAKLERLEEIVDESAQSGWKMVVFSFFRDVLASVVDSLDDHHTVFGPMTGSMASFKRQALVEAFSAHEGSAVLVSQIEAGGVGLNVQAASVVVLCEPQWKPSVEEQAIARCHRMGQIRPVRVHRLLAEDGVDARMLEILEGKAAIFDAYVRDSSIAQGTPSAIDISETEAARRIIEEEAARLRVETDPNKDEVLF